MSQVDVKNIESREGTTYEIGKSKPFSGVTISYFDNGQKHIMTEYKDGKIEGKLEGWYQNGKKQVEGTILNGKKSGEWIAWFENGQKLRQGSFLEGKEEGAYIWWFENGNFNKKGEYHNGEANGKWEWYYENGQKKQEGILIGEVSDGIWKDWYENGNQKMNGSFKKGVKDGEWIWWDINGKITTRKVYADGVLIEGTGDIDAYIEQMEHAVSERDFNIALSSIEKALSTVKDKSESNAVFMGLAVYHSEVYSWFQHLDEAERVLLKAVGLPDKDVEIIINAVDSTDKKELETLVKKISKYPSAKTKIGPHVGMAFIYNILGDTINLRLEQQLMMERSGYSDWVIKTSMALYRVRGSKQEAYGNLKQIRKEILDEGETNKNQMYLAHYLSQIGKLREARQITDKYLKLNPNDLDFLVVKMNIEMAEGNVSKMKECEDTILKIDPKAFEK